MGKLSDLIRKWLHPRNVIDVVREWIGDVEFDKLWEVWLVIAASLDQYDEDKDGALDKAEILAILITGALKLATGNKFRIPKWVVNGLVEAVLAKVRIPDFEIPIPDHG